MRWTGGLQSTTRALKRKHAPAASEYCNLEAVEGVGYTNTVLWVVGDNARNTIPTAKLTKKMAKCVHVHFMYNTN